MTTQISGALQHMNGTLEKLAAGSQNVTNAVEDITSVAKEGSAGIQDIAASAEEQLHGRNQFIRRNACAYG